MAREVFGQNGDDVVVMKEKHRMKWYEVMYCADLCSERFNTLHEAQVRARQLIADDEDDVHIVMVTSD